MKKPRETVKLLYLGLGFRVLMGEGGVWIPAKGNGKIIPIMCPYYGACCDQLENGRTVH